MTDLEKALELINKQLAASERGDFQALQGCTDFLVDAMLPLSLADRKVVVQRLGFWTDQMAGEAAARSPDRRQLIERLLPHFRADVVTLDKAIAAYNTEHPDDPIDLGRGEKLP